MNCHPQKIIGFSLAGIFALLVVGIGIRGFINYKNGPSLYEISLSDGMSIDASFVDISARLDKVVRLSIQGRNILIPHDSLIHEKIVLTPGMNTVIIEAEDIFGKKKDYQYTIISIAQSSEPVLPLLNKTN